MKRHRCFFFGLSLAALALANSDRSFLFTAPATQTHLSFPSGAAQILKLSLADAFAAALAKEKKAEFITGDPEFKCLEKEVKINWLK